jgi:small subunit ribosomal protein S20
MPNKANAAKALRQNKRRRLRNVHRIRTMEHMIKEYKKAIASGVPIDELKKIAQKVQQAIDKAAQKGPLHKNTASRKKSRILRPLSPTQQKIKPLKKVLKSSRKAPAKK